MAVGGHGQLTTSEGIHIAYQWSYADAAARTGATGFVAADVGKMARQLDNNTYWTLTATTPTWAKSGGPDSAIDHGSISGLGDDDHTQYLLVDGSRAGATGAAQDFGSNGILTDAITDSGAGRIAVNDDLDLISGIDVFPNGDLRGFATRLFNPSGLTDWVSHFRTGDAAGVGELVNYTWDNTPSVVNYSDGNEYLSCGEATASQRDFLYMTAAGSYLNKILNARISLGLRNEIGLRIDDSADPTNNFCEIYMSGAPANGTIRLDFRYGATTVNSSVIIPAGKFIIISLRHVSSTTAINGYLISETNAIYGISGFNSGAQAWIASAFGAGNLRAGLFTKNTGSAGNNCFVDWFSNSFT